MDPDTDPDPAFQVNHDPIRIHGFDDHKLKNKKIQMKNFFHGKIRLQFFEERIRGSKNYSFLQSEFETMALERKILKAVFLYMRYLFSFPLRDL